MEKRVLLITGSPGTGKTTVLLKTVDLLKAKGFTVGGMLSREVRSGVKRIGFEILDVRTEEMGWLAHTDRKCGPQIGKYYVNLTYLDAIGTEAVRKANGECEIVVIDEIGPMELLSEDFRRSVKNILDGRKLVIATLHWKRNDQLAKEIEARQDTETFIVTYDNRDSLPSAIVNRAVAYLATSSVHRSEKNSENG